jgi:phospholipid/cholesterol/gamma-HCH transport system permease protein
VNAEALRRLRRDLVPQVFANAFSVLSLAMVSSDHRAGAGLPERLRPVALGPARLHAHGRPRVRPGRDLGFVLKTVLFGLAVAVIPTAAILELQRYPRRLALERAARRAAPAVRAAADRRRFAGPEVHLTQPSDP